MPLKRKPLAKFLSWSAKLAGKPYIFITALIIIAVWFIFGLIFGMTTNWLLIIDTIATINASLMVFIIQNTQIRESKALHLKIDELIKVTEKATNELIAAEELEDEDLEDIRTRLRHSEFKKRHSGTNTGSSAE